MAPKVSIVTCSYNRPELLRLAVQSLRDQTDQDWEHLIYDDASTDPEVKETLAWALEDPRVRVWLGQENLNRPSVLWNFMLDRAMGRYFTILDDDNEKINDFVSEMSRALDRDQTIDLVTCGWRVDREEGPLEQEYYLNLSTSAERLKTLSTCDGGAMLYRRELFERAGYFSEEIRTNEDWDWLRRAVHVSHIKNLKSVHATYRSHNDSRMKYADELLGNKEDVERVKARALAPGIGCRFVYPRPERLTQSQQDVCGSISKAVSRMPWVSPGRDLAVIVSPFQQDLDTVSTVAATCSRALSIHMEDPYALTANLDRVRRIASIVETWVCTNDAGVVPYYRKLVGNRVIVCPTLGPDDSLRENETPERDIDILLCGYAYPSRKRFVAELLPHLNGTRVTLVGDGWEHLAPRVHSVLPTQPLKATYLLHRRAKTVVCLHRIHGDCSDGPTEPLTVNRGAMEGFSGARVFVDKTRPLHAFDDGDVVWYDSPQDLARRLHAHLKTPKISALTNNFAEKCGRLYTYRTRLARVINCVRSPRFLAEIP